MLGGPVRGRWSYSWALRVHTTFAPPRWLVRLARYPTSRSRPALFNARGCPAPAGLAAPWVPAPPAAGAAAAAGTHPGLWVAVAFRSGHRGPSVRVVGRACGVKLPVAATLRGPFSSGPVGPVAALASGASPAGQDAGEAWTAADRRPGQARIVGAQG